VEKGRQVRLFRAGTSPVFPNQIDEDRRRVRETEVTGIPPGVRSEALECVQLADAFSGGSSLPTLGPWPSRPSPLHGRDAREINQPPASWRRQKRQQAARTPKLRSAHSASRPLALAGSMALRLLPKEGFENSSKAPISTELILHQSGLNQHAKRIEWELYSVGLCPMQSREFLFWQTIGAVLYGHPSGCPRAGQAQPLRYMLSCGCAARR
jgi:hypothetical protein